MGFLDIGASDLLGGALGFMGAQQTNQSNWDISQSNNAWSASQFAQRYQTTVADLQKAGLNPMLAYGQGGGSPPTAAPVQPMQNKIGSALSGYNERRSNDSMVALQGNQAKAAEAQANASDTQSQLNSANTNLSNVNALKVIQDTAKSAQDIKTSAASEASLRESINLINEQTQTQKTQQRLNSASEAKARADASTITVYGERGKQDIQIQKPEVEKSKSWWGRNVSPYLRDAAPIANSAIKAIK